jgi:hypothetical protein
VLTAFLKKVKLEIDGHLFNLDLEKNVQLGVPSDGLDNPEMNSVKEMAETCQQRPGNGTSDCTSHKL